MPTKLSRYSEGIMEAAWLAAVIVVPVFFNVYSSRIFEPDKLTLLRSISLVILAAWIVKILETGRFGGENNLDFWTKIKLYLKIPFFLPVICLIVIYFVATLLSVTPRISLFGSYQRLQGTYTLISYLIVFFAMIFNIRSRSQVGRLITAVIVTSLPVSLYGVLQKYQIDPIPWGGDVSRRIAANLGNSIFVGAYLIMVFSLTVMRIVESFEALLTERGDLLPNFLRATTYVFIATLQAIALYYSGSRGPWLGWGASLAFLWLGLSLIWRKRWLTISGVILTVMAALFLVTLNIPNGPLQPIRDLPGFGRLGQLLDVESRTGRVRTLIWSGAVDLVLPHEPIEYPDGEKDRFNIIRPVIGYGPESMYVAYNPFYPPELTQVELRNASPDRSHNETWDSLVITGMLGLLTYLFLFGSVIYYGLSWLGLVQNKNQRNLFFGLFILGGLISSIVFISTMGGGLFGVALPFGMILGVLIYLIVISLIGKYSSPESISEKVRAYLILGLLATIVAHFVEINFGIAIAATRTYFWVFTALLFILGFIFHKLDGLEHIGISDRVSFLDLAYQESFDSNLNEIANNNVASNKKQSESNNGSQIEKSKKRKRKTSSTKSYNQTHILNENTLDSIVNAYLMIILLITLGFNMISNSGGSTAFLSVIGKSMFELGADSSTQSLGVFIMVIVTWIVGSILLNSETEFHWSVEKSNTKQHFFVSLARVLIISLIGGFLYWSFHAGYLASLAGTTVNTMEAVIEQVIKTEGLLTVFYVYLGILILIFAFFIPHSWPVKSTNRQFLSYISAAVILVTAFITISITNLRIIQADIAFKAADSFTRPNSWPVAINIYQHALDLAPNEDYYYLFLGRAYLEHAKSLIDPEERDALIKNAAEDLRKAQRINPLNTDHTANLARLYSLWSTFSDDEVVKNERETTSSNYFSEAVTLSPQNARIWDEWGLHYLAVQNLPDEAYPRLNKALELDPYYDWTYGLLGDYYAQKADSISEETSSERIDNLEKALDSYSKAIENSSTSDSQTRSGYLVALAGVYSRLNRPEEAISNYEEALRIYPDRFDRWQILEVIAHLYFNIADVDSALYYAQSALGAAPEDQKEQILEFMSYISSIQE